MIQINYTAWFSEFIATNSRSLVKIVFQMTRYAIEICAFTETQVKMYFLVLKTIWKQLYIFSRSFPDNLIYPLWILISCT